MGQEGGILNAIVGCSPGLGRHARRRPAVAAHRRLPPAATYGGRSSSGISPGSRSTCCGAFPPSSTAPSVRSSCSTSACAPRCSAGILALTLVELPILAAGHGGGIRLVPDELEGGLLLARRELGRDHAPGSVAPVPAGLHHRSAARFRPRDRRRGLRLFTAGYSEFAPRSVLDPVASPPLRGLRAVPVAVPRRCSSGPTPRRPCCWSSSSWSAPVPASAARYARFIVRIVLCRIISIRNLNVDYDSQPALKDVSVDIPDRQITGHHRALGMRQDDLA